MDSLVMFSQGTRICVPFEAVRYFTRVGFGFRMCPCMFVPVTWIGVPFITTRYGANIGLLSRVRPCVNFQVLEPRKAFAARVMVTPVGPFTSMCPHVYQHFVPRIEPLSVACATLPQAAVFASFSSNVVFVNVCDEIFQGQEVLTTVVPFALVKLRQCWRQRWCYSMRQHRNYLPLVANLVVFENLPQVGKTRWVCCDHYICGLRRTELLWCSATLNCFWCRKLKLKKKTERSSAKRHNFIYPMSLTLQLIKVDLKSGNKTNIVFVTPSI